MRISLEQLPEHSLTLPAPLTLKERVKLRNVAFGVLPPYGYAFRKPFPVAPTAVIVTCTALAAAGIPHPPDFPPCGANPVVPDTKNGRVVPAAIAPPFLRVSAIRHGEIGVYFDSCAVSTAAAGAAFACGSTA